MAQSGGGGRARRGAGEEAADGAGLAASRFTDSIGCVSLRLNRFRTARASPAARPSPPPRSLPRGRHAVGAASLPSRAARALLLQLRGRIFGRPPRPSAACAAAGRADGEPWRARRRRSVLGARGRLESKRGGARVPGLMQSCRARRDCHVSSMQPPRLRASCGTFGGRRAAADDRLERRLRPRAAAAGGIGGPRPRAPAIGGDPTHLSARARCAICARAAPSARLEAFWATWLT